jgi:hypothetical protein
MSETNTSIIELLNLEGNFDDTLRQYKKEYANYVTSLDSTDTTFEIKPILTNLDILNSTLLDTNQKIVIQMKIIDPQTTSLKSEIKSKIKNLLQIYSELLVERKNIKRLQDEYETINMENVSQTKNVNHQYAQYLFWAIISVVVFFLTCRLLFFPNMQLNPRKFYFWAIILSFLFISGMYSYNPPGFVIFCTVVVYIILGFMNILPMP